MAVVYYLVFIAFYSLLISLFGHHIKFSDAHPYYFIPPMLFMLGHYSYSHRLLFSLATGLAADLFTSETWAMHATFFCVLHIILQKILIDRFIWKAYVFIPISFMTTSLLQFLVMLIDSNPLDSNRFFISSLLTMGLCIILFPLFKLIRLGWGLRSNMQNMPVLNG